MGDKKIPFQRKAQFPTRALKTGSAKLRFDDVHYEPGTCTLMKDNEQLMTSSIKENDICRCIILKTNRLASDAIFSRHASVSRQMTPDLVEHVSTSRPVTSYKADASRLHIK